MIAHQELRKKARELEIGLDMVEKDYVLGWMLYGVASSLVADKLIFKGGTALSKVYFPDQWRLSEDLDFTSIDDQDWNVFVNPLSSEIPSILQKSSGIEVSLRTPPHTNPGYFQSKFKYTGPIGPGTVKIEITREEEIGEVVMMPIPQHYDYPKFSVKVYSLETILAEKLRSIIQRGKVRDYYDVWRLLKENKVQTNVRDLFLKKCETKNVEFTGIDLFFPENIEETLTKHMPSLTRLTNEPINIEKMLSNIREQVSDVIE